MKSESHATLKSHNELKHFKLCYGLSGQINSIIDHQINDYINIAIFLKKSIYLFIYLFIYEKHRDGGRDTGRGRVRLPAKSLMQGLIWGPQDHALSQRHMLNR